MGLRHPKLLQHPRSAPRLSASNNLQYPLDGTTEQGILPRLMSSLSLFKLRGIPSRSFLRRLKLPLSAGGPHQGGFCMTGGNG